jgi:hypothetical protein
MIHILLSLVPVALVMAFIAFVSNAISTLTFVS